MKCQGFRSQKHTRNFGMSELSSWKDYRFAEMMVRTLKYFHTLMDKKKNGNEGVHSTEREK